MLFTLTDIITKNDIIFVSGVTHTGSIKGIWKSSLIPVLMQHYSIEIDFSVIDRNSIIINKDSTDINSEIVDDRVIFTCLCEDIDEIYYIRFSFDGLEMLDIKNDDFTIKKGDFITFSVPFSRIGIYPY
ncbi:MAG: hypothetical protein K2K16_03060 [Ruminococcus sp.]|nr:hypothetical protein [Ruminococcus sp.]